MAKRMDSWLVPIAVFGLAMAMSLISGPSFKAFALRAAMGTTACHSGSSAPPDDFCTVLDSTVADSACGPSVPAKVLPVQPQTRLQKQIANQGGVVSGTLGARNGANLPGSGAVLATWTNNLTLINTTDPCEHHANSSVGATALVACGASQLTLPGTISQSSGEVELTIFQASDESPLQSPTAVVSATLTIDRRPGKGRGEDITGQVSVNGATKSVKPELNPVTDEIELRVDSDKLLLNTDSLPFHRFATNGYSIEAAPSIAQASFPFPEGKRFRELAERLDLTADVICKALVGAGPFLKDVEEDIPEGIQR